MLALATNTSPDVWRNEDIRTVVTAVEILEDRAQQMKTDSGQLDEQGRQMSG